MAFFKQHHPYDPNFALPNYVRSEPPGRGAMHSFGEPRGTISQRPTGWTGGYALPDYIKAEPDGRGAVHSYWDRRKTIQRYIPSELGATRSITEAGPIVAKAPDRFRDHPLIGVGPWTFNPKGARIEIADGRLDPQGKHMRFLHQGIADVSKLCNPSNTMAAGMYCRRKYNGWTTEGSTVLPFGFNTYALKGKIPIYKVENPIEGGMWGIYLTRKEHSIVVEFKKVPATWWQKLTGWIKTIVGIIIDTVSALFDFMGVVACQLARDYLGQVAAFAAGKAELTPGAVSWLKKARVTDQEIDIIETSARANVSQTVANKIVSAACGGDSVPTASTAERAFPIWVLPAAVVGGVAFWWFTRRKK